MAETTYCIDELKALPEDKLLAEHSDAQNTGNQAKLDACEDAIYNYNPCDVCGFDYHMDEPCTQH